MKVLGIVGSNRKAGNTALMVKEALGAIESYGIETEIIFLGDYDYGDCIGCEGCRDTYKCVIKDDMQKIYPLIEKSDAIVIGSPTYFYNVTAKMKAFLDRMYCYEIFSEDDRSVWMSLNEATSIKYAATIAVCEQHDEKDMGFTSDTLNMTMEALGYRVIDKVKILGAFNKGDVLKYKINIDHSIKAGEKLAKTLLLKEKVKADIVR
ncbi:flavodoxin family protein [Clostridium sp. DL1XJH146]